MDVCPDFEDLFKTLNKNKIKYLVVGAHAVMFYSQPRYTKDLDVWVIAELNDSEKVFKALREFGAPLIGMTHDDFQRKSLIYQIGVEPVRIDIIVDLEGIDYKKAWEDRKKVIYGKVPIHMIGFDSLVQSKQKANRPQDRIDLEKLKKTKEFSKKKWKGKVAKA